MPKLHPVWVLVLGCCALLFRAVEDHGLSNDVYWQLASGKWMLAHHALMSRDVFTYTVPGRRWVDEEWGFQLILAGAVRVFGPISFVALPAGSCAIAVIASLARWRRLGASWFVGGACVVLATSGLLLGDAPRPQTFSYLLFALELWLLSASRSNPRWLVAIPALTACWANLHGSFLLAEALIVLELVAASVPRAFGLLRCPRTASRRALVFTLAASFVAGAFNPDGIDLYRYAFSVTTNSQLAQLVSEWQSPNFHSLFLLMLVVVPSLVLLSAILAQRTVDPFDLCCFAGMLVIALHSQRFLPYVPIAFGGLAAGLSRRDNRFGAMAATAPVALGLFLVLVLTGTHAPWGSPQQSGSDALPVAATRWLQQHPGRVFSTYAWGDYLIDAGIPVFVDGRTDLYFGTDILTTWEQLDTLSVNPDSVLDRWQVQYVLWPRNQALSRYLAHDRSWHTVERSGPAVVLERVPAPR